MDSNSYCSSSFEPEIIKIGQSPQKMYSNNILNIQKSTIILNAYTKKVWIFIEGSSYIICTHKLKNSDSSKYCYVSLTIQLNISLFLYTVK